jgi:hypothetical protein
MIPLFLQKTLVSKPLLPRLVHDDFSRMLVSIVGIILCGIAFYKIGKYFNGHK